MSTTTPDRLEGQECDEVGLLAALGSTFAGRPSTLTILGRAEDDDLDDEDDEDDEEDDDDVPELDDDFPKHGDDDDDLDDDDLDDDE